MLDTIRHDALFDKNAFLEPIHIVGVGGVGSHVAYLLAKLGAGSNNKNKIRVWDGDVVATHNAANQTYNREHFDKKKVLGLREQYRIWSDGVNIEVSPQHLHERAYLAGVVFLCLDRMTDRKAIIGHSIAGNKEVSLVLETRMDALIAGVFAINPNNKHHLLCWEEGWYPDDASQNFYGCNGPVSIITSVTQTAVLAVNLFLRYAAGTPADELPNHVWLDQKNLELTATTWPKPEAPVQLDDNKALD